MAISSTKKTWRVWAGRRLNQVLIRFRPKRLWGGVLDDIFGGLFALLYTWQARAEARQRLAEMEPRSLEDMGLTPAQARHEAEKPFWRP